MKITETATNFVKTKKGQTTIAAIVGGVLLYLFPESAAVIGETLRAFAEIFTGVADKVEPAAI